MSTTVVDWDEVVAGQFVYDPSGKAWRVVSRWSDGTVILVDRDGIETKLPPTPRGPVTVWGPASMEEAVQTLAGILGARVVEVDGKPLGT